jgi:hypothetical protein
LDPFLLSFLPPSNNFSICLREDSPVLYTSIVPSLWPVNKAHAYLGDLPTSGVGKS